MAALAIRIPLLNKSLFGDAIQWARFYCTGQYWFTDIGHPSLSGWLTNLDCLLFGVSHASINLPNLIVSLALIVVVYTYGKKLFSKNIALIATFLLAINPWFIDIGMAPTQDNYLTLFFAVGLFSYLLWLETKKTKYMWIIALMFGLSLITKSAAIILPAIIFAHQLILLITKEQKLKTSFILGLIMLSGIIIPIAYYTLQFTLGSTTFTNYTLHRTSIKIITAGNYSFPLASWVLTILLFTPALSILLLVSSMFIKFNDRKSRSRFFLLFCWIGVPAIIYSFLIIHNNIERFMQITLPAIMILVSVSVYSAYKKILNYERKNRFHMALFGALLLILLVGSYAAVNPHKYPVPHYAFTTYFDALKDPANFYFPIMSDMGPAYYLPLFFILVIFGVTLLLCIFLFLGFIKKNKLLLHLSILFLLFASIISGCIMIYEQYSGYKGPDLYAMHKEFDGMITNKLQSQAMDGKKMMVISNFDLSYPWKNISLKRQFSSQAANLRELYMRINATEGGWYTDDRIQLRKYNYVLYRSEQDFRELAMNVSQFDFVAFENYPYISDDNVLKKRLNECYEESFVENNGMRFSMLDCQK
jgi:4-amino-4-deoxy-L-arabinose transferase-like glycosyltransferase